MAFWSAPTYTPICPSPRPQEFHSGNRIASETCLRMLAFHILKSAFADAARGDRVEAAHALRYLRQRSDWTAIAISVRLERWGSSAPPPEIRAQYVLSCDWCLQILDWPDSIRRTGLPIARASTRDVFHWGQYGGLSSWRQWRSQRKLIQRARAIGKETSFAKQKAKMTAQREPRIIETQQTQPLNQRHKAMAVSA